MLIYVETMVLSRFMHLAVQHGSILAVGFSPQYDLSIAITIYA